MFAPKKGPHLTSLHPDRFKKLSPCTTQYTSMLVCSPPCAMYQCQYALPATLFARSLRRQLRCLDAAAVKQSNSSQAVIGIWLQRQEGSKL